MRSSGSRPRATLALQSLNFFMADAQAGIGPFVGDIGYGGERFRAVENAPADTQISSPFAGLGVRF